MKYAPGPLPEPPTQDADLIVPSTLAWMIIAMVLVAIVGLCWSLGMRPPKLQGGPQGEQLDGDTGSGCVEQE